MFPDHSTSIVTIAIRDTMYLLDFVQEKFSAEESRPYNSQLADFVLRKLREFSEAHLEKFIGLAMSEEVAVKCPCLCSCLWAELDIIPYVLPEESLRHSAEYNQGYPDYPGWSTRSLDEQSESMGRKCVRCVGYYISSKRHVLNIIYRLFGPEKVPLLQVGFLGMVEVDTDFQIRLAGIEDFKKTVGYKTWAAIQHYATDMQQRNVRVALFSATPQGGGVALMRHSLVRLTHALDVDFKWQEALLVPIERANWPTN